MLSEVCNFAFVLYNNMYGEVANFAKQQTSPGGMPMLSEVCNFAFVLYNYTYGEVANFAKQRNASKIVIIWLPERQQVWRYAVYSR